MDGTDAKYTVVLRASPFSGYLERFTISRSSNSSDLVSYLGDCFLALKHILLLKLKENIGLKFWLCASTTFHKSTDLNETIPGHFPNTPFTVLHESDIAPALQNSITLIVALVDHFEEKGSSWVLSSVDCVDLYVGKYEPLRASSYAPLPNYLLKKRAIVNPKNFDQKCFMWAVLAALYPKKNHRERISQYDRHIADLNLESVKFPMKIDDIDAFCRANDMSVNVYGYDKHVYPLRLMAQHIGRHVNLLYYGGHYSWIRSFDRLLGDQNKHKARGYYCETCLFPFNSQKRLDTHKPFCGAGYLTAIAMPDDTDNILQFKNYQRMIKKPVVVYADFEVCLKPTDNDASNLSEDQSYTLKYQKHEPCSVGLIVSKSCCGAAGFENLSIQTCPNPAQYLIERLVELAEASNVENRVPLVMSDANERAFQAARECMLCKRALFTDRVRDHCHVCGRYRAALHSACNQLLRLDRDITVVLHNLRRYDSHIVMREIGAACESKNLELKVIARAMEDYTTFYIQPRNGRRSSWRIRFIDSVQFLSSSLEKLVETLTEDQFVCMKQHFNDKEMKLLTRKGVFPYDHLDSPEKLEETEPVTKAQFYNRLTESDISDHDYEHYLTVWREMGIKKFQDYLELYLKTDVLLLADVFEAFRSFAMEKYGLDPCHYSTLPGFAWDACLKMTGVKLELLTDPDMYTFMENGIRGGMAYIAKRYAKSDVNQDIVQLLRMFIIYFDGKFQVSVSRFSFN